MIASIVALVVSASALTMVRSVPAEVGAHDAPAASAAPVLKVRLAYGGLLIASLLGLVPATRDAPLYAALLLFFAGTPMLGHQAIGLTPARRGSRDLYRLWLLSAIFPALTIAFGVSVLLEGRR